MKACLFFLTARETLWCERTKAIVAATDEGNARSAMTCGSDSLWVSVAECEQLTPEVTGEFTGYQNCDAFVLKTW